ncbi:MAG: multicopper oxidase domain-containing protein [Alphaproteobacteria bacterium]|nr:multicopper oxidase domain-containing protein [Alphaproteobacteria bacterium]
MVDGVAVAPPPITGLPAARVTAPNAPASRGASGGASRGTSLGTCLGTSEDSIPLPVADPQIDLSTQGGYCTIGQWPAGQCNSPPLILDVTFTQVGDFVYHCHILAHEDFGMMAKITVVPSPD